MIRGSLGGPPSGPPPPNEPYNPMNRGGVLAPTGRGQAAWQQPQQPYNRQHNEPQAFFNAMRPQTQFAAQSFGGGYSQQAPAPQMYSNQQFGGGPQHGAPQGMVQQQQQFGGGVPHYGAGMQQQMGVLQPTMGNMAGNVVYPNAGVQYGGGPPQQFGVPTGYPPQQQPPRYR